MHRQKLIIINGFAGSGKSTIAKRYIDEHPLALNIEGDKIIVMLGQWINNEAEARKMVFELTKAMAATQLEQGKDVVITYLLTDATHAAAFELLSHEHQAEYKEVFLLVDRNEAIARLLQRGTWGEDGLDPLTEKDLPSIQKLFDTMVTESALRSGSVSIQVVNGDIDHTYSEFLKVL